MSEGKHRRFAFRVVPLITNLQSFRIEDVEGRQHREFGRIGRCAGKRAHFRRNIGTRQHRMGQVSLGAGKGDGKFGRGVHVTVKDIGKRLRAPDAWIPDFHNRSRAFAPGHLHRTACFQYHNRARVGGRDGSYERILVIGQGQAGCVPAFAHRLRDEDNSDVCGSRQGRRRCRVNTGVVFDVGARRMGAD